MFAAAAPMLRQKRMLVLAGCGLILSTLSFGAGVGMLLPILHLMLEKKQPLGEFLQAKLGTAAQGRFAFVGDSVADILPSDQFHAFLSVMALVGMLTVVGAFGRVLHFKMTNRIVLRAIQLWQKRVFSKVTRLPLEAMWKLGGHECSNRLFADPNQLTNGLNALLGKVLEALLRAGASVAVAFAYNPKLTALALFVALPGMAVTMRLSKRLRKLFVKQSESGALIYESSSRALGNPLSMKAALAEGVERRRFHHATQIILRLQHKGVSLRQFSRVLQEVMGTLGAIGIACYAGYEILRMGLEPSVFIAVIGALGMAAGSLKPLTELNHDLQISDVASERILSFERDLESEKVLWRDRKGLPKLPPLAKEIRFENVSYTYPGKEGPATTNLSLSIQAGEFVAIVGANGSGKSTLMLLLGGYVPPSSGRILFDGRDIAHSDLHSLRSQISMVAQRTSLVGGTIAENIAYGHGWQPRSRIVECAKIATCDEFITQMPGGYEMRVGANGEGLSGGQAQRVCIARALLRDPVILILDEATSQVDSDSESRIAEAMGRITAGRTTIAIAHRLSTVIKADRIIVMDQGRIVAQGTHQELLAKSPDYRSIANTQMTG